METTKKTLDALKKASVKAAQPLSKTSSHIPMPHDILHMPEEVSVVVQDTPVTPQDMAPHPNIHLY